VNNRVLGGDLVMMMGELGIKGLVD